MIASLVRQLTWVDCGMTFPLGDHSSVTSVTA